MHGDGAWLDGGDASALRMPSSPHTEGDDGPPLVFDDDSSRVVVGLLFAPPASSREPLEFSASHAALSGLLLWTAPGAHRPTGIVPCPSVRLHLIFSRCSYLPQVFTAAIANRSNPRGLAQGRAEIARGGGLADSGCLWPGPAGGGVWNRDLEVLAVESEARDTGRRQPADFAVLLYLRPDSGCMHQDV